MSLASARTSQLVLSDLPQTDCDRLQAFVRLGSSRLRRRWAIGLGNNIRVVLCGSDTASTIPGVIEVPPRVVRVVDPGTPVSGRADTLVRPFGFDDVIDILVAAEASMADGEDEVPMKAPEPAAVAVEGPAPTPAPPKPEALSPDTRVRLKRWPPADVLCQWRHGIRLASFLSARPISARELALLSSVAESECKLFVDMLLASGVLRVWEPERAAPPPAAAPTAHTTPAAHTSAASTRPGLLGRLRRKLGIVLGA